MHLPAADQTMRNVLVTKLFLPEVNDYLAANFVAHGARDEPWNTADIVKQADGADALLITLRDKLPADAIEALPSSVKAIATASIGLDHIDLEAAERRRITVISAPGLGSTSTAELTMLLMLGAARRAYEGDRLVRSGRWTGWHPTDLLGVELDGKRLGIYGMGCIGQLVARRARAFGMQIHYCNRTRLEPEIELGAVHHRTVVDLLAISDFVSLHAPSTSSTRRVINKETLTAIRPHAILVNTARGDLVDDEALIGALASRRLAAVGLDVYDREPLLDPRYAELENAFLLPHLGTATREARLEMTFRVIHDLEGVLRAAMPEAEMA